MKYVELHNFIRSRFKTEVADVRTLPTVYDNDPSGVPTDGSAWCRFTIVDGASRRITNGIPEYRLLGVAYAQLFFPLGRGEVALQATVDAVVDAFRGHTADAIRFGDAYPQRVGPTDEGDYYQINVVCPFQADTQER